MSFKGPSKHVHEVKAKRKRKRDDERNEFLPDRPAEELEEQAYGNLEFNEVLDEEVSVRIETRNLTRYGCWDSQVLRLVSA
jgi:hypothetical protein